MAVSLGDREAVLVVRLERGDRPAAVTGKESLVWEDRWFAAKIEG